MGATETPASGAAQPPAPAPAPSVWNNELFWGTVGAAAVTAVNGRLHLGLPDYGAAALTVGMALAWGCRTILADLARSRATHGPLADAAAAARLVQEALDRYGPQLEQAILARLKPQ